MNTMEITKEDRILLKELEQKFENQETLTETQKEILVDYYETEVMRKEQDLQAIEKEIDSYNDKLRKLNLKKESEKVSKWKLLQYGIIKGAREKLLWLAYSLCIYPWRLGKF